MSTSILPVMQSQLNLYGYSICLTLGNIGNIFIVIIFKQRCTNACSIYLMSSAITNSLYLTFNSSVQIFPSYYNGETLRTFALFGGNATMPRRDNALLIIVITEVFIYVISTTLYPLILLEMMIGSYITSKKSVEYSQIETFIFTIAFLLLFANNAIPFYTYLIVSK
ncbi:unnamed protein product [Rotaria socialis]|uniref:G-protein coupled receptors family 1 profile domain-containing protein n=1 Tax=Rotaria socialis TaxID=392032 RepID=A0A818MNE9_9BILA|nr:unnamed protein product [Rotaria socialis]CAF4823339.1 unnamed protein product [Rotaria socialis]